MDCKLQEDNLWVLERLQLQIVRLCIYANLPKAPLPGGFLDDDWHMTSRQVVHFRNAGIAPGFILTAIFGCLFSDESIAQRRAGALPA